MKFFLSGTHTQANMVTFPIIFCNNIYIYSRRNSLIFGKVVTCQNIHFDVCLRCFVVCDLFLNFLPILITSSIKLVRSMRYESWYDHFLQWAKKNNSKNEYAFGKSLLKIIVVLNTINLSIAVERQNYSAIFWSNLILRECE